MKCWFPISDIECYCYSFSSADSRMYLLFCNKNTLIVDPCKNENAIQLLMESGIENLIVVLSHEHYDHISGVNYYRKYYNCNVICNEACAKLILDCRKNLSAYYNALMDINCAATQDLNGLVENDYSCYADQTFSGSITLDWGGHILKLVETPGHSKGSICTVIDDKCIFTGDTLLKEYPVTTKLPGGNIEDYYTYTVPFLQSLSQDIWVLPGHHDADILGKMLSVKRIDK